MKNSILIAGLAFALGLLGWWFVSVTDTSDSADSVSIIEASTKASVLVTPQPNSKEVLIQKATLTEPGFLVLREVINGTAAQIVEISQYLEAGTYTDISIPVGEFYTGDSELMVVMYADVGNDQILNDLDQPFINNDGASIATYVTTGLSVPNEVVNPSQETLPAGMPMMMGMGMPTITYTNEGFQPATLEVGVGAMVHFVNESDTQMWVASDSHPAHDILPTFDQFKPGDMFMYVFEETGTWEYHDHLNPTAVGTIIVEEN